MAAPNNHAGTGNSDSAALAGAHPPNGVSPGRSRGWLAALPLRTYLAHAVAILMAVGLAAVFTGSSATQAVPRPAEASPAADDRFATDPPSPGPDRNADRDAIEHDDTLAPPPPGGAVAANGTDFVSPVPGPISGGFGPRFHPILHYWRMHNGVDMHAGCGTVVVAAYRGKVIQAGPNGGYGNLVVLDHGQYKGKHVITKYAHLSRIGVRVGDRVQTGEGIALSGTTGLSTGCHLHFEIEVNGVYVDPAPYLTGKSSPRPSGPIPDLGPKTLPRPSTSPTPSVSPTPSAPPSHPATPSPSPSPTRSTPTPSPSTTTPTPSVPTSPPPSSPSPSQSPTPKPSPSQSSTPKPSPKPDPTESASSKPPSASPSPTPSVTKSSATATPTASR